MPTETAFTRPDSGPLPNTFGRTDVHLTKAVTPTKPLHLDLELLFAPPISRSTPHQLQSTADPEHPVPSIVPHNVEADDEYTLSAYGDISLAEIVVPQLPVAPTPPSICPLQPRNPQPRLRLKVRRPPMPKRRISYIYVPDPLPHTGDMVSDQDWPGSPRPFANLPSWSLHQPLVSTLPADHTSPGTQGNKDVKRDVPSLENLVDELLPNFPSIRLSPPGSPASQALSLPQETGGQKIGVRQGDVAAVKVPQSPPAPRQEKPWRSRLPPRPPIPKWDDI